MRVFHSAKGNAAKGQVKEKAKPKPEAQAKAQAKAKIKAEKAAAKAAKRQKAQAVQAEQSEQAVASAVTAKERLVHLLSAHAEAETDAKAARAAAGAGAAEREGTAIVASADSEVSEAKATGVTQSEDRDAETIVNAASVMAAEGGSGSATEDAMGTETDAFYSVVVYTPQDLEAAQAAHAEHIVVKGELAKKLRIALKSLGSLSVSALNALALCVSGAALFAPFTGGVSLGAAGTVMGTVGAALTATAIAAISAIGLSLVLAVLRGYDEIKLAGGGLELHLQKKKAKATSAPEQLSNQDMAQEAQESAATNTATTATAVPSPSVVSH